MEEGHQGKEADRKGGKETKTEQRAGRPESRSEGGREGGEGSHEPEDEDRQIGRHRSESVNRTDETDLMKRAGKTVVGRHTEPFATLCPELQGLLVLILPTHLVPATSSRWTDAGWGPMGHPSPLCEPGWGESVQSPHFMHVCVSVHVYVHVCV